MRKTIAASWLGITLALGLQLAAQAMPVDELVESQLEFLRRLARRDGYALAYQPMTGRLAEGRSSVWRVKLRADREYFIAGVCDDPCKNLDLAVFYQQELIRQDLDTDPYPMLRLRPERDGDFVVETRMTKCERETCGYGLTIFVR